MPTYFSTNDGNFSTGLATAVREVSGGTTGLIVTTTNSFAATALSPGATYTGVALQLSAVSGSPAGTIDLTLSGNNGTQTSGSFPVSGLTQLRSVSIAPTTPVSWQYFSFDTPITFASGVAMTIGVKTSVASKVSLMGTTNLQNLNRAYVTDTVSTPNNALDSVHIVGTLSSNGVIPRTVNYDVATVNVLGNLYVHNKGTLNFDPSINIDLTLSGGLGFQITQEGTVNIGTSSNNVQSDKLHNIKFSSAYLNVHNGATFNAYGAYKTPYALLNADTVVGADAYPLVTDVSNWTANNSNSALADSVVICPNTSLFSTTETSSVKTKNIDGTLTVWTTAAFAHDSSDYIPSVLNMTRNVRLSGGNFYARFLDGSVTNLNNVQFNGLRNTAQKGLQFCTNSTGSVSLSNCAFNGSNLASTPAFSFIATKTPAWNVSIKGCNFSGYGATTDIITLDSVSANNFTFTDNIVVDSSQNGMFINALSSTYANIKNNFLIGNTQNGLRVVNPYLVSGSIGGIGCINGICGSVVAGTNNRANYDGLAGHYNTKEGVNILGTIPQLSSTIFSNITANNNTTVGVEISGNSNNLLSPIKLNINGLVSNNNGDAGFEGYAITGNLSSMTLNNNVGYGIKTSIGNGVTIFDNVSSEGTLVSGTTACAFGILSAYNYFLTTIRNSKLVTDPSITDNSAILLDSSNFEQFSVESSVLSSYQDVRVLSNRYLVEGSYQFNNCTFNSGLLSSTVENYQPEVFTENGFVVMKENGIANKHYRLLKAGKVSLDETLYNSPNTVSEKLEPTSTVTKLRCGSKMVPVNKDDEYTIGCFVYKSNGYSGDAPRLVLRRNTALGYNDTVLATSVGADQTWEPLSYTLPAALDAGIFEVYVDCSGEAGCGSVNIDSWSLTLN